MEAREIVAYLLIALIAAGLFAAWRYATSSRRAHNRAHRAAIRRARERAEHNTGQS